MGRRHLERAQSIALCFFEPTESGEDASPGEQHLGLVRTRIDGLVQTLEGARRLATGEIDLREPLEKRG
jgi:hypothetical protein